MKSATQSTGLTLLEILLVLLISVMIALLGIRQYQMFLLDANVKQVEGNVHALFTALNSYYHAECYGIYSPGSSTFGTSSSFIYPLTHAGTLYPTASSQNTYSVDILKDLTQTGFLSNPLIIVPFVQNKDNKGYIVQFNRIIVTPAQPTRLLTTTTASGSLTATPIGTIVMWQPQVAVQLATTDAAMQETFKNLLGGDCLSTATKSTVSPCSTSHGQSKGNYVVWTHVPGPPPFSLASYKIDYWQTIPQVTQFTQMYTTYPINYLTGTTKNAGQSSPLQYQYFPCTN